MLVRQRPARPGNLYAGVLPLLPHKAARLHEWALELNGIHAAEFEESLRRLGHGLTLFVQHTSDVDLVISVAEGEEPEAAALDHLNVPLLDPRDGGSGNQERERARGNDQRGEPPSSHGVQATP